MGRTMTSGFFLLEKDRFHGVVFLEGFQCYEDAVLVIGSQTTERMFLS